MSNAVYSRQTQGQITRQTDQGVAELSMQRITAVTSCDHRRNEKQGDGVRVTGGERGRQKQVRREGGGGVVESKKRIEQWRESMFPMRSIELSIILLQAVDGSSWDEEEREEGRKRCWRQMTVWGGTGRSCFTGNYLQCRVWWWTLCCNANLLSCLSCGADCRGQIHKRQERGVGWGGGDSNRMEMRGKERKKRREQNKGMERKRQRRRGKRRNDALNWWQKKREIKITRDVQRKGKEGK